MGPHDRWYSRASTLGALWRTWHCVASTRQPQRHSILSDLSPDAHVGYLVRIVRPAVHVVRRTTTAASPPPLPHGCLTFHPARLRPPLVEESDGRLWPVGSEPVLGGSAPRPVTVALLEASRPPIIRPLATAPPCPSPPLVGGSTGGRAAVGLRAALETLGAAPSRPPSSRSRHAPW